LVLLFSFANKGILNKTTDYALVVVVGNDKEDKLDLESITCIRNKRENDDEKSEDEKRMMFPREAIFETTGRLRIFNTGY
jgi:hypothetical protein